MATCLTSLHAVWLSCLGRLNSYVGPREVTVRLKLPNADENLRQSGWSIYSYRLRPRSRNRQPLRFMAELELATTYEVAARRIGGGQVIDSPPHGCRRIGAPAGPSRSRSEPAAWAEADSRVAARCRYVAVGRVDKPWPDHTGDPKRKRFSRRGRSGDGLYPFSGKIWGLGRQWSRDLEVAKQHLPSAYIAEGSIAGNEEAQSLAATGFAGTRPSRSFAQR
jgi:hypothetical protein